jgi:hypothetical protein
MIIRVSIAILIAFTALSLCSPTTTLRFSSPAILVSTLPTMSDTLAPRKLLFVGNSFTGDHSLHHHVSELAQTFFRKRARHFFIKSLTISGAYLSDQVIGAKGMIVDYGRGSKRGGWDAVVLQGHSLEPINKEGKFQASARQLDEWIRHAGAKTVLFMTWAYKHHPNMITPIAQAYTRLGHELDALVVPVGLAFERARIEHPELELYASDSEHSSLLGSYLAANVFFATLYGQSPVGNAYRAGLSKREAELAQTIAWKTVQAYFVQERKVSLKDSR